MKASSKPAKVPTLETSEATYGSQRYQPERPGILTRSSVVSPSKVQMVNALSTKDEAPVMPKLPKTSKLYTKEESISRKPQTGSKAQIVPLNTCSATTHQTVISTV